ncbi:type IV secretion system DNA-binding domain-containing protein [Cognatishimia activa]|uniref:Type IV secretion system DNA-binding domain-containing protein n=2 Tax=Cognatishimia activa TaxID=1715691 RepID=A0A975EQB7_9RHOB|nr:type IV secretion system DNA-binding domain-containing protein [Cognatishimia activa]
MMSNPFSQPVTTIGEALNRRGNFTFGIYRSDRLFHQFILGQTGTGKSTLMRNMIAQDIRRGEGFCLIDPHGDLAQSVQDEFPNNAIYWDVADPENTYGYNPLTYVAEEYRPLVASGIIDALKSQWADAWGVRMEHCLRYAILALLARPHSMLKDIVPMFTKRSFRAQVLKHVTDEEVLKFWHDEYANMNYKNAMDGVAPIANKLGVFLSHPVVRKVLCEPKQPIRFRKLIDEGTPLVINLSKGRLGSDISEVLGGLMLSMITNAAMTRDTIPEYRRRPYFVYVDEFASFTTETIAGMLSELRKYRVGVVLAGQYLSAIEPPIRDAIFGNVGNLCIFRCGATDAPALSKQLGQIDQDSLINLPNYRMFTKIMVNGTQTKAFSARTMSH